MYAAAHAAERPDDPALILAETGEEVTFAQFEARANQFAQLLRAQGLRRGDHIALVMENNLRVIEASGAAERTGLYYTAINSYLAADEVAYIVNDCRARVVITSVAMRAAVEALPGMCAHVERWLVVDGDVPGYERYETACAQFPAEPVNDEELGAAMLYSSGTTGLPKGIQRSLPIGHPRDPLPMMRFSEGVLGFHSGMRYLSPAPLYHAAPQGGVNAALRFGATAVIMRRFDPLFWMELVQRHRITTTQMVPTMFSRLLKLPPEVRAAYDTSSLQAVTTAAAPCPVEVKEQMIEWLGPVIREYYSATEGNGMCFCDSTEWLAHKGTVGRPVFGEVVILGDDGQPVPRGTTGAVWFRGATDFEYFGDAEKTAASRMDMNGVMASTLGDVGYLDDDGFLFLTDRQHFMIISGGVNIYPQETESLLVTHPLVLDAAVIGVPDADLGEQVKAVVQLVDPDVASRDIERQLIDFCRKHIAHYKCPRSVDFVDTLPRLPTGKLYKKQLDRYREAAAAADGVVRNETRSV